MFSHLNNNLLHSWFRSTRDPGNLEVLASKSFRMNPDLESVGVVLFSTVSLL